MGREAGGAPHTGYSGWTQNENPAPPAGAGGAGTGEQHEEKASPRGARARVELEGGRAEAPQTRAGSLRSVPCFSGLCSDRAGRRWEREAGAGGHQSHRPAAGRQLPPRLRACVGGENNSALRSNEKIWAQAPRILFENISDSLSFSKCLPHRV